MSAPASSCPVGSSAACSPGCPASGSHTVSGAAHPLQNVCSTKHSDSAVDVSDVDGYSPRAPVVVSVRIGDFETLDLLQLRARLLLEVRKDLRQPRGRRNELDLARHGGRGSRQKMSAPPGMRRRAWFSLTFALTSSTTTDAFPRPLHMMADDGESLVARRPKRSTAGNRYMTQSPFAVQC